MAAPVGQPRPVLLEPGERLHHLDEGLGQLHQRAEGQRPGEIDRARQQQRHHRGDHPVARAQPHQLPLGPQQLMHGADHAAEGAAQPGRLVPAAADQRHRLGALAQPHQGEAMVGFGLVAADVDVDQRPADQPGQRPAGQRIDHRHQHQAARHRDAAQAHHAREHPEHPGEGDQGQHRVQQAGRQIDRHDGRPAGILADPLVRVVGGIGQQPHAVVAGIGQPALLQVVHQPAAPAQRQHLPRPELRHRDRHAQPRQQQEQPDLAAALHRVALLQRVEEVPVPEVQPQLGADLRQGQDQGGGGQPPGDAHAPRRRTSRGPCARCGGTGLGKRSVRPSQNSHAMQHCREYTKSM